MNATYNATTVSRSGAICNYVANVGGVPLSRFIANITPIQAGSGDPSPSNPRPITGRSAVNVARTGVNVWDEAWELGAINTTNGQDTSANNRIRSKNYIVCVPNTTYFVKSPSQGGLSVFFYDINKDFIRFDYRTNATVTSPSNALYMRFCNGGADLTTYNNDISINYPATDTAYHASNDDAWGISLYETVYGGTLNVSTGLLTITYGIVDLGSLTWKKQSDAIGDYFRSGKPTNMAYIPSGVVPNAICELYTVVTSSNVQNKNIAFSVGSSGYTFVRDTSYTDAQTFKTAMDGVHLVYELATPVEHQLTPAQVTQLLGENNVWCDSGDSEVDFFKIIRT